MNTAMMETLADARALLARAPGTVDGDHYLSMMVGLEIVCPALADEPTAHGAVLFGAEVDAARLYGQLQGRFDAWWEATH